LVKPQQNRSTPEAIYEHSVQKTIAKVWQLGSQTRCTYADQRGWDNSMWKMWPGGVKN